ncbi:MULTISPECIES: hypothetical protein [unclassified Streptomyces]|uniref:hypothetical protein n=1 Tax=unclassified Streptomyces TaxID=2593676 RepID=UPI00202FF757|nr:MULTISPECIES: hypothetical protein [unclassified Streptomyces]MCM1976352.1 hypothetical protein [Streptomyces sp. G1]MCX5123417.1 hypothetical protein [Streptomyces sp. NBC_00347]
MTAIEQYLVDTYRASQHGTPMPPPPGQDDVAALRAARAYEQFRAVLDGAPGHHPWRSALHRRLTRRHQT